MARLLPPPPPPPRAAAQRLQPPSVVQRAAAATFAPTKRVTGRPQGSGEELVSQPDGTFRTRDAERGTLGQPNGTYNFVRVQGQRRGDTSLLVSPRLPHAHLAAGRPVIYAGTARLEAGKLDWWSNFSGTYQPIAEFRAQAALPVDKFITWQRLQLGGIGMQRGMLGERRRQAAPTQDKADKPTEPRGESGARDAGDGKGGEPAKVAAKR